jgi:hypothetical protein
MARNLTSLLFTDSLWRVVWEESDGKQYITSTTTARGNTAFGTSRTPTTRNRIPMSL